MSTSMVLPSDRDTDKTISLCPQAYRPGQAQRSMHAHSGTGTGRGHRGHITWIFNQAVDLIDINLIKPTLTDLEECKGDGLRDTLTILGIKNLYLILHTKSHSSEQHVCIELSLSHA